MNSPAKIEASKRATNISLPVDLVEEARRLKVNLSAACERGLVEEVRQARAAEWLASNREALDWSNAYVEKHGIPLARHRKF